MENADKNKKSFINTLAGAGVLIVIVIGAWSLARLAPGLKDSLGFVDEFASRISLAAVELYRSFIPRESITLTLKPADSEFGKSHSLTWKHSGKQGSGSYSLSFPCVENIYLIAKNNENILCTSPLSISNDSNLVEFTLAGDSKSDVSLPITLSYKREDQNEFKLSATALLSIKKELVPPVTSTIEAPKEKEATNKTVVNTQPSVKTSSVSEATVPKTVEAGTKTEKVYTVTSQTAVSNVAKIDLRPVIISVGKIDKNTNVYTATTSLKATDRIAVRFIVENIGGISSGHWQFSAVLPSFPMHIFESEGQEPLGPGDRIEYTLGFDNFDTTSNGRFTVNVDPTSSISEISETNNIATTTITVK